MALQHHRSKRANSSRSSGNQRNAIVPAVELAERQFALQPMPLLTIADLLVQSRQQIKGDIRRLEIPGISVCHVMRERSEGGSPRKGIYFFP